MHRQIATILGNRLGREHARFFARPQIDPSNGQIDWYAPVAGPVTPVGSLEPGERARVETLARQIRSEIAQLGQALKAEGASAELVGRMIDQALVTPPDQECLYLVGSQPVQVLWGHELEGGAPAGFGQASMAEPPVTAAGPSAALQPTPVSASPVAAASLAAAPKGSWHWLAWLLPLLLLLLLALLTIKACEPLPPQVVEMRREAPAPENPLPALEARERELRDRLAALESQEHDALAACGPMEPPSMRAEIAPEPPVPEPDRPPEPAPVPGPKLGDLVPPIPEEQPTPPPQSELPKLSQMVPPMPKEETTPPPSARTPQAPPKQSCNPNYPPGEEPEIVLIVDGSKSMDEPFPGAQTRMDMSRKSISNLVRGLPKPVDVALVEFTTCTNVRRDRFYSAPEREALIREVERLTPTGGTPLARSIERAGNIVSGQADSTIVVVSDGEDTCNGDPCAAARAINREKPNVTINVIDISGGSGRSVLQCVAGSTGGKVLTPQSGADMLRKMQQASGQPDTRACK